MHCAQWISSSFSSSWGTDTDRTVSFVVWGQPLVCLLLGRRLRGGSSSTPSTSEGTSIAIFQHQAKRKPLAVSGVCVARTEEGQEDHMLPVPPVPPCSWPTLHVYLGGQSL